MKVEEILIKIFTEATGQPKQVVEKTIALFREASPAGKWDEEITGPGLENLLKGLKVEKHGIKKWLLEGAMKAE